PRLGAVRSLLSRTSKSRWRATTAATCPSTSASRTSPSSAATTAWAAWAAATKPAPERVRIREAASSSRRGGFSRRGSFAAASSGRALAGGGCRPGEAREELTPRADTGFSVDRFDVVVGGVRRDRELGGELLGREAADE